MIEQEWGSGSRHASALEPSKERNDVCPWPSVGLGRMSGSGRDRAAFPCAPGNAGLIEADAFCLVPEAWRPILPTTDLQMADGRRRKPEPPAVQG